MSMQCLRTTTDAREFETRLRALRNSNTRLDAIDLAEIATIRTRVNECAEIALAIIAAISHDETAKCVASSVENAFLAIDHFATQRKESYDSTILNDGSVDAWGWDPDCDCESTMSWRATIRITKGGAA